jgi:hypothetical protein
MAFPSRTPCFDSSSAVHEFTRLPMMSWRRPYTVLARCAPGLLSWWRVLLAVVIAAAAWIGWQPALRVIFVQTSEPVRQVVEGFDKGALSAPDRVKNEGFEPCTYGWCLAPGASGTFTYEADASDYMPGLMLWHFRPPDGGTLRLFLSTDGGARYQLLTENSNYVGQRFDLPLPAAPGRKLLLRYEATNPSPNQALVIDQLLLDYRTGPVPPFPKRLTVFLIVLSFGLVLVVLGPRWPLALSTVLILALAASLRYEAAIELYFTVLDPDVGMYRYYAGVMKLFSETGFFSARFSEREPLHVFVLHVYSGLFGDAAFNYRLVTVILSTLSVWAVMRVGRALFGDIAGQFTGLAMALNIPLIAEAARGLRLELEIVLCMAFFGLAFARKWRAPWPLETLAMAAVGAVLVSARSTYVPIVLALGTYAVFRRVGFKAAIGGALITTAVVAACVVPHRYNMYKLKGDPYWDTTMYARWNANWEFVGKPGFPTANDLQTNGYIGPRLTYREYMLGMHTPWELVEGTSRGYWKLYRNMEAAPFGVTSDRVRGWINITFQVLGVTGFLLALWKREYLWIPLAFLLFEFPVSFLYDRGLVEPYRHSYSAFPLVLFATVLVIHHLCTKLIAVPKLTQP